MGLQRGRIVANRRLIHDVGEGAAFGFLVTKQPADAPHVTLRGLEDRDVQVPQRGQPLP